MTLGFDRPVIRVDTGDGHHIVHVSGFSFGTKSGETITVTPQTGGDGASTPPWLWPTIPPFGWYWLAVLLHDYVYRYLNRPKDWCDALLLESMLWLIEQMPADTIAQKVKKEERRLEAELIYKGVVEGGQSSFDEDRKNQGGIK